MIAEIALSADKSFFLPQATKRSKSGSKNSDFKSNFMSFIIFMVKYEVNVLFLFNFEASISNFVPFFSISCAFH
jgi:hypothetical protein